MVTRILIVDDNEHVRKHLRTLLQNADRSFVVCGEAGDGQDAVTKAGELKPDVIILDLAMPVMDGVTAAREISKTSQRVAMFMYTLHTSAQLEVEAKTAGIRGIVAKPATADLVSLVREAARANSAANATAGGPAIANGSTGSL
jgi:DNA-binding NarL/FixJ family response regulator